MKQTFTIIAFAMLSVLAVCSCGGKNSGEEVAEKDSLAMDTTGITFEMDTVVRTDWQGVPYDTIFYPSPIDWDKKFTNIKDAENLLVAWIKQHPDKVAGRDLSEDKLHEPFIALSCFPRLFGLNIKHS